jgi:hypothetical protein
MICGMDRMMMLCCGSLNDIWISGPRLSKSAARSEDTYPRYRRCSSVSSRYKCTVAALALWARAPGGWGLGTGATSPTAVRSGIARKCCPCLRRYNKMNQSVGEVRCANASCKCRDTAVPLGKHSSWMTDQRRKNGRSWHEMIDNRIDLGRKVDKMKWWKLHEDVEESSGEA